MIIQMEELLKYSIKINGVSIKSTGKIAINW